MLSSGLPVIVLIGAINILSGVATAGINLSIGNIGIMLAPKNEAIVYLSARSMLVASVSSLGPLLGGFLADYFSDRSFTWNIQWNGPKGSSIVHLFELHSLTFLFIIGGVLAIGALRLLRFVKEEGEISTDVAVAEIKSGFKTGFKDNLKKEAFISLLYAPVCYPKILHKKIKSRIEHRVIHLRKWRHALAPRRSA